MFNIDFKTNKKGYDVKIKSNINTAKLEAKIRTI